jgi:hypothetical protein
MVVLHSNAKDMLSPRITTLFVFVELHGGFCGEVRNNYPGDFNCGL